MIKFISFSRLSESLVASAFFATILAGGLLFAFSGAQAATTNILVNENLSVGSTGQGVVALQGLLSEMGYLEVPTGVALGYYGPLTQKAVSRYQIDRRVYPSAGYFGPLTKVSMHQDFVSRGWLSLLNWN